MKRIPLLYSLILLLLSSTIFALGAKEEDSTTTEEQPRTEIQSGSGTRLDTPDPQNVARVNDEFILQSVLEKEVERYVQYYQSMGQQLGPQDQLRLKTHVLQTMINQKLLIQEFDRRGLSLAAGEIATQISEIRQQFPSEEEFMQTLAMQGYTLESLESAIGEQVKIDQLMEQATADVALGSNEVREYYDANQDEFKVQEAVRASHILIRIEDPANQEEKEAALAKITSILNELTAGAEFSDTARKNSDCPSGAKGGDLGYFQRGQMVKPFEDAAWQLEVGEISSIVETDFGYHIIRKSGHQKEGLTDYAEVKEELGNHMLSWKQQEAFEGYMLSLRESAAIEIFDSELHID